MNEIKLPPLPKPDAEFGTHSRKQIREYAHSAIELDRQGRGEPVQGERFLRAWINLDKLPGIMMVGPEGRFGPIAASTSCWITTSEKEAERLKAKGPVLEVWATPRPAAPTVKDDEYAKA